jgi:cytochrome P450
MLPTGGGPDHSAPVYISKGATVIFSPYTLHRRPDIYGMDAELFRPERWEEDMLQELDTAKRNWSYIPFHGGARTCIGSK